jgi:hypothetical protein
MCERHRVRHGWGVGASEFRLCAMALVLHLLAGCNGSSREVEPRSDEPELAVNSQALVDSSAAFHEAGGLVVMEAENFHGNTPRGIHHWDITVAPLASAGQVMVANPDFGLVVDRFIGTASPRLDYQVQFRSPGTYYVWVRGRGQRANEGSCHVGIDGVVPSTAREVQGFRKTLQWSRTAGRAVATLDAGAGLHTINLFMREDGFAVDKVLLTTDPKYVPTGAGPTESPRVECNSDIQCNDGNPCTDDACHNGTCTRVNNVAPCDEGNRCTIGDVCANGACAAGAAVACTASDQCHDAGTCDPTSGACSNPVKADGIFCDDGNACTQSDTCLGGSCTGANPVVCAASDQCHGVGTCDPTSGACSNPATADGIVCNDGNACTQSDTCLGGSCTGANPVVCAASDQCHDVGTCDPTSGACSNPATADGIVCNDGNACTQSDTCVGGSCAGANPVACAASDQCHGVGTCDPTSGVCSNPATADGVVCNDGNACTQSDTCVGGSCTGANPVACAASDQCHGVGTCDPTSGACSNPAAADGIVCNDGNACTQSDTCLGGSCTGANPVVCAATDQCHGVGTCDPTSGACSNPAKADGTVCIDGIPCTSGDACKSGVCAGSAVVCTTGQACSTVTGSCEAVQTATFRKGENSYSAVLDTYLQVSKPTTSSGTAQDWLWDTDDSSTSNGTGSPVYALIRFEKLFAADGGPIPARSQIVSATLAYTVWNTGDSAKVHESLVNWDESTTYATFGNGALDSGELGSQIATASGAAISNLSVDVTSSLSDWSFGRKSNLGWIVVPSGTDSVRARSSDYTTVSARPRLTVAFIPYRCISDVECDDDNVCNGIETCREDGVCLAGTSPTTDDGNPCTMDSCDPVSGVRHTNQAAGTACADGNLCNGNELCDGAGNCTNGSVPDCRDDNPCTTDSCDSIRGCVNASLTCTSGQACNPVAGRCAPAQTVTFQRGTNGYSGVLDTHLGQTSASTSNGSSTDWIWDTDDSTSSDGTGHPVHALIRFGQIFASEGGPIPDRSVIGSATLAYTVSNTGDAGTVHECLVSWNESTTYSSFGDGALDANEIGRQVATATGAAASPQSVDVTSSLANWSAGQSANLGWIIVPNGGDSVRARSSEYTTVSQRPALIVTYFDSQCMSDTDCDDNNLCTDDVCDATLGCQYAANAASCNDGDPCTENDACHGGACTGSAPLGDVSISFLVHGPPSDSPTSANGIYLKGTNGQGTVHLDEVGPALWRGVLQVPRAAGKVSYNYSYARDLTALTMEVGPWGEALGSRSIAVRCTDLEQTYEETVWNWDDQVGSTPAPADKGPTVSVTRYDASTTATVSIQLATADAVTLHYSTGEFLPVTGGYAASGPSFSVVHASSARHEFELTDLTPSTTYYYYVEYGATVTSQYHFTTGGAVSNFRFVAYGDSQATDESMRQVQRELVELGYSFHPSVVLRTGDETEDGRTASYWDYFFAIERPMLSSAVYLTTLGNHEYAATNYYNLFALPQSPASEQYYAIKYGNTLFIALNTEVAITGAQTTWLSDTLDAANADPDIRWKVAYFHQPPYSSGMHGSNVTVRNAWHPLFRDKGVRLVLSGHDHDFEYLVSQGVNYYVIGGAGSDLRTFTSSALTETVYREAVYHTVVVDVSEGQLVATPYRRDHSVITEAAIALTP